MYKIVKNKLSIIEKKEFLKLYYLLEKNNVNIFNWKINNFEKEFLKLLLCINSYTLQIGNNLIKLKNKEKIIIESIKFYRQNKKKILYLSKYYDFDIIIKYNLNLFGSNIIFYNELFTIFQESLLELKKMKEFNMSVKSNIDLKLYVWNKGNNMSHNYRLVFENKNKDIIFLSTFLIWKNSILIETLQYMKLYYNNYQLYGKLHRYWIVFWYFLLKKLWKKKILAFSDFNNPYSYHKWFFPIYNNFLEAFWFSYNNGYYYFDWKIKNKYIKYLNFFENNIWI